jgi:hypothetical protein
MHECTYCNKSFVKKDVLIRHVKSSKRCIKARAPSIHMGSPQILGCVCGYTTVRKDHYVSHQESCVCTKIVLDLQEYKTVATDRLQTIEDHVKTIAELKEQVKILMTRPINVNNHNTTNNNGPTYNMSYYKQHIQDNFESITQPLLQGVMNQITLDDISYGGAGLAKFVKKHLDHQHLLMLDQARRKGAYKDAKGQVVVDAKLRILLQMIGEAAYPPAKKIFIDWNTANPDVFLNSSKSKILTNLLGATGWLNRVGEGKTDDDDSEILSSFVDELASGYTKEALHNHLDQHSWPPEAVSFRIYEECDPDVEAETPSGDETDVSSDWPEIYEDPDSDEYEIGEEYETDIETASITSSQFDVVIGTKNYEACHARGTRDEDNLYENFKPQSTTIFTN